MIFSRDLTPVKQIARLQVIAKLLTQHKDIFSKHDTDIGHTHLTEHVIESRAQLVKSAPRRIPLAYINEAQDVVQKFFNQGSVRP